ncbi:MAG: HAD-IB family phosphatase [Candidatus Helarchaeota archaeon]
MVAKDKIKLVVFDMDGTLTKEPNSWGLIHSKLGVKDDAKKNAELFFSKAIDYTKWAELDINLWIKKGVSYQKLKSIVENNVEPVDGAKETISALKSHNIRTLVISSGLTLICNYFKKVLNYDDYVANKLIFDDDLKLKGIEVRVGFNKDIILQNYIKVHDIPLECVASIGDNINDIGLFKITPISIAINPKSNSILKYATHTIFTNNLLRILPILI